MSNRAIDDVTESEIAQYSVVGSTGAFDFGGAVRGLSLHPTDLTSASIFQMSTKEDVQAQVAQYNEQLVQYQSLKDEYKELSATITTLPDATRHNIMVPFGGVAFMPGNIHHILCVCVCRQPFFVALTKLLRLQVI